jgi:hypothetical protein
MRAGVFGSVIAVSSLALGAAPAPNSAAAADQAVTALAEKQKEREAQRSAPAAITVGELDDLRAEVTRLRAENASLKGKPGGAAAAAAPAKRRTDIEVGMTRDELIAFVKSRPTQYQIGDFSTKAGGVQTSTEQFITKSKTASSQDVTRAEANNLTGKPAKDGTTSTDQSGVSGSDTTYERRRLLSKQERVSVKILGNKKVVVGHERNSTGEYAKYGNAKAAVGELNVTLVEDVVTEVARRSY